ncbi:MAG: hypothetical protein WC732_09180 [Candidatus Omnitrophota bacterium]
MLPPVLDEIRDVKIELSGAYHLADGTIEYKFANNEWWTRRWWSPFEQRRALEIFVKYDATVTMGQLSHYRTIGEFFDEMEFPSCQVWAWPASGFFFSGTLVCMCDLPT